MLSDRDIEAECDTPDRGRAAMKGPEGTEGIRYLILKADLDSCTGSVPYQPWIAESDELSIRELATDWHDAIAQTTKYFDYQLQSPDDDTPGPNGPDGVIAFRPRPPK